MSLFPLLQETEPGVIQIETAMILALLLITGVALIVRKFRVPYTVTLVFAGLLLAFASNMLPVTATTMDEFISSELILAFFVPPLIFEGALHINWRTFRENLIPILLMAIGGVLLGTFIIGGLIEAIFLGVESLAGSLNLTRLVGLTGIPFTAAAAFGALISATDPVAVIAFFRTLGVDRRLSILVEGESLLNDGTSIVVFRLALALGGAAALAHGQNPIIEFSLPSTIFEFTKVAVGGLAVGLVVGKLAEIVLARTDNRLIETTLTIPAAFGAYLLAEQLGISGILSVVAAGIYLGDKIPMHTSPTTKIALYNFWEVLSFIVTSLIFLVIGWVIDIRQFFSIQNLILVLAAVIAILIARSIVVYGMSALANYGLPALRKIWYKGFRSTPIPTPYQHVMFWGGLRGAISLALALSLDADAFGVGVGSQLRLMTFGAVLFTLLVQGTTIERQIKHLRLAQRSQSQLERERALGRYFAARGAQEELNRLHRMGIISGSIWQAIEEAQREELEQHDQAVRDMMHRHPGTGFDLALQVRRLALQAKRTALAEATRREIISEDVQEEMLEELDAHLEAADLLAQQLNKHPMIETPPTGDTQDE